MKRTLLAVVVALTVVVSVMTTPRPAQALYNIDPCVSNCSSVALTGAGACGLSSLICGPGYEACYTACIIPVALEYGRCLGTCNGGGGGNNVTYNPTWATGRQFYDPNQPVFVTRNDSLGNVITSQGSITGVAFYTLNLDSIPLSTLSDTTRFENRPWQYVGSGIYNAPADGWQGNLSLPNTLNGIILRFDFQDAGIASAVPGMTVLMPASREVDVPPGKATDGLQLRAAPNPSHGQVALSFTTAKNGPVMLGIYDLGGHLVRMLQNGQLEAGTHSAKWDGANAAGFRLRSGMYFVRLRAGNIQQNSSVLLLQ